MPDPVQIAFDVGSIALKTVVLNESEVFFEDYRRTHGRPLAAALDVLRQLDNECGLNRVESLAVTGSGGQRLAEVLGGEYVNEIIAWSHGIRAYTPHVRTAMEMGGEDSKLLIFEHGENATDSRLQDFSMNSLCAAGTGSFLDQQATRLGVHIEKEFGELALQSETPPRIAGRCSVFAKSDMIHLQQIATPVHEIAMGLCLALARSYKSTVGRGIDFVPPVAFMGGVASNAGMVEAFEQVLGLEKGELIIPEHHRHLGAIGAALSLESRKTDFLGIGALEKELRRHENHDGGSQKQLRPFLTPKGTPEMEIDPPSESDEKIEAYVGIDIGSVSTNVVVIDSENRVLAKRYLWTASKPIEAVRQGLEEIREEIGDRIQVCGAGTTGSGRYLIGELVGADVIRNEITAQATAAIMLDPEVDTIFEIGGQDSKYISIDHGTVCDFEMNKACAAGTGSFLSEQAERLGIDLKEDFSRMALDAANPVGLGDRCTVFMESDLIHHQQAGAETPDLLGGLAYSIVHNYLNRVVGDRRIGDRIFFQGGTAFNKAVVAAFNAVLEKEIVVPPHHEVTGAIGVAMLAREKTEGASRFRGFDFSKISYEVRSFTCRECDNMCEIRQVRLEGQPPLYFGSRCEKFEVNREDAEAKELPDLFAERERWLMGLDPEGRPESPPPKEPKGKVGIPLALSFHEYLPFWRCFFEELGFEVMLSPQTNRSIVNAGVEAVVSETCFPVKVAHGHILNLLKAKPDLIFLPSLIDTATEEFGPRDRSIFNCPLVQTIPYTARSGIRFEDYEARVFSPELHMQWGLKHIVGEMAKYGELLEAGKGEIKAALTKAQSAQEKFAKRMEARGREVLESLSEDRPGLVIVARPYNGCDLGSNLDLPRKIRNLGALPIPMDMLPLSDKPISKRWEKVYWRYGQRIMKSAELVKGDPNLFAVYITNFSCGPDSFILDFFRKEMDRKPYLTLEIDEHSADAGLITRCEAFLDTLENLGRYGGRRVVESAPWSPRSYSNHRKIYIPNMAPQAHMLAAVFQSVGVEAEVMAPSNEESIYYGERHTSGRECYPCLLTTGDIIRQTRKRDFDPKASAFFMASADGPCRFGQYNQLHREVLDKIGMEEVPIFSMEQGREYEEVLHTVGTRFERRAWWGIAAVDVLEKLLLEKRPYEIHGGETDTWFTESVAKLARTMSDSPDQFHNALKEIATDYEAIEFKADKKRPRIGIVGEIYVRMNPFANQNLVRRIEELGGEVLLPSMGEWVRYTRHIRSWRSKVWQEYGKFIGNKISSFVLERDEARIYRIFGRKPDAGPRELFHMAESYLKPSFEGESILTIGKAVEFIRHDSVKGIVNTMPFTCMPGTICSAILKRVREDHHDIPLLNMAFTVQQSSNNLARLEAFMYQARAFNPNAPDEKETISS
ncbi:MAG: acyl-CoA dehydratase activase [Candidatus Sumerlaeia bacterium]